MPVDEKLLEILACPKCKGDIRYVTSPAEGFVCDRCALFYEVEDDIPNFIIEDARPWEGAESHSE
jgi:uncharacterized protein YbaR (Trm112 family)